MKRFMRIAFALALFCLPPGAASAADTPAAPVSVLFYPNEIHLTVEERLMPEAIPGKGLGLRIILPLNAARNTFSAVVDETPANGFYWLDQKPEILPFSAAEEEEIQTKKDALLASMHSLRAKIDERNATIKAGKTRLSMLEDLDINDEKFTTDDILKLDAAFAERLEGLYATESKGKRDIEELQKELTAVREELHKLEAPRVSAPVAHHVAVIPFSDTPAKPVLVRYRYIIPGSSQTSYRLTAYPARDILAIEQDVTLFQDTGISWENVDISISTTRRDPALRPAPLAPWHISLSDKDAPPPSPAPRARAPMAQMSQLANIDMAIHKEEAIISPVQEEKGTFRLWHIGRKNVASSVGVTLPLAKDEYTVGYYYTLYPSMNPKGFLTASLALDKALELPQGPARLFVDTVAVGDQTIAINGTKATIFFGADPQVTATMRDLQRTTGEKGLISKEQSQLWHWEIIVRNTRGRAVDVRVQDPLPEGLDTAVKLAVTSTPKAEETVAAMQLGLTKVYQWAFTLQPNEAKTIEHKVEITAPADKILYSGRRD